MSPLLHTKKACRVNFFCAFSCAFSCFFFFLSPGLLPERMFSFGEDGEFVWATEKELQNLHEAHRDHLEVFFSFSFPFPFFFSVPHNCDPDTSPGCGNLFGFSPLRPKTHSNPLGCQGVPSFSFSFPFSISPKECCCSQLFQQPLLVAWNFALAIFSMAGTYYLYNSVSEKVSTDGFQVIFFFFTYLHLFIASFLLFRFYI